MISKRLVDASVPMSLLADHLDVRDALNLRMRQLRDLPKIEGVVADGRDAGSIIFPDAPFRFFFHADPETRALRRRKQGQEDQIEKRDAMDSKRKEAPLTCPEGAIAIDTAPHTLEEVIQIVLDIVS